MDLVVPPEKVAAIRARYEGKGVDPADGPQIVVAELAAQFGVHANSIYIWAKRHCWRRPKWFRDRRPYRRYCLMKNGAEEVVLTEIRLRASFAAPCPTNEQLARELGCSVQTVQSVLRRLIGRQLVRVERRGPERRLLLADGRATLWTGQKARSALAMMARRDVAGVPQNMIASREAIIRLVREAAEAEAPFPSNSVIQERARCSRKTVTRILAELEAAGAFKVERRSSVRRAVYPDGVAHCWGSSSRAVPGVEAEPMKPAAAIDLAVVEATRELRRQRIVVFDTYVVTGGAPGRTWSVDGRKVDRQTLLEIAARRNAAAVSALAGASRDSLRETVRA